MSNYYFVLGFVSV